MEANANKSNQALQHCTPIQENLQKYIREQKNNLSQIIQQATDNIVKFENTHQISLSHLHK